MIGGSRARDPQQGAGDPAPRRPPGEDPQLPRPALRRRAAARLDRPRLRQPPAAAARRRADRQPRPRDLDRDHAAALPDQPHRHDRARRHPRPRDGRQDAPPRDRSSRRAASSATRPPAATTTSRPRSSPRGSAPRWASATRADQRPDGTEPMAGSSSSSREAFRALRRNAAPSLAAIVTIARHDAPARRPDPRPQGELAKTTTRSATQLELQVFLYDDATQGAGRRRLGKQDPQRPARRARQVRLARRRRKKTCARRLGKATSAQGPRPAEVEPAARRPSTSIPTTPTTSSRIRHAIEPAGRERQAAADHAARSRTSTTAPGDANKIRSVTGAVKIVLIVIAALLLIASRDAGRQHDPALDLRPPPRGRGDAAGRRDQLVHPLAVRDRGRHRRASRAPRWPSASSGSAR